MFDAGELEELGGKLAGRDPALADDGSLQEWVLALEAFRRRLDSALGRSLAELEARGTCDRDAGCSTASWLAREAGLPPGVARARVRVGTSLRDHLPGTEQALAEGRIGWDHARTMGDAANPRIRDAFADVEDDLLAASGNCAFERWRQEVQGLADLLDQDGGYDPDRDPEANRLSLGVTGSTTSLRGTLVGDTATVTRAALDRVADELFRRYTADHGVDPSITVPARSTLLALALAEICRRAGAVEIGSSRPPRPEATYLVRADDPYDRATTPGGVVLQDGTTRVLRCVEDLRPVVVDALGQLLDLGRRVPFPPPDRRRAMEARDGGCVFPGCDCPPAWCDAHHVDERSRGGRTDVRRMALLCRHHHRITHRRGWRMHVTDDQWFWWESSSGRRFWSQRHGRRRDGQPPG